MYRIVAAFLVACVALPAAADYQTGLNAYKRQDFMTALKEFKAAAKSGSPKANYRAGQMYYRGEGAVQDYALALRHFERAAEVNLVEAQYMVAYMHENKQGVRRSNPTMAFNLYRKAADNGHAKAQFRLATIYAEGIVVPQNLPRAFKYYESAAERGNARAQFEIARMFDIGLDQSVCLSDNSMRRCRKGATKNLAEDLSDSRTAADWYTKSAKQGYAPAQFRLGEMFDEGKGRKKNVAQAQQWYQEAANQGMVEAQYKLAGAKQSTPGNASDTSVSDKDRLADLRLASKGDVPAQIRVAKRYDKGVGVTKDYVQAYAWYNVAASAGSPAARASRDAIEAVLNAEQIATGQRLAREISRAMVGN